MTRSQVASVLFLLASVASPARADLYTYTYTGNPFTSVNAPGSAPDPTEITASITFSQQLAPNSIDGPGFLYEPPPPADVVSWTVSDGVQTVTSAYGFPQDNGIFILYTGPQGNITDWIIALQTYPYAGSSDDFAINSWGPGCTGGNAYWSKPTGFSTSCAQDFTLVPNFDSNNDPDYTTASNSGTPGTWTETPEPGGMGMLAMGMALIVGMWIRGTRISRRRVADRSVPATHFQI